MIDFAYRTIWNGANYYNDNPWMPQNQHIFEKQTKLFISVIESFQDEIEHMLADTERKEQQMSEKTPPFEDLRTQHKDATEKYEGKNKLLVCT